MPTESVIVGSSPHLLAAAAARLAATLRRVPFVLEVRDLWPESLEVADKEPGLTYRALRLLADILYRTSRSIVVLAAGNTDRIVERGIRRERIHFIPNGVDPSAFEGAEPAPVPGVPDGRQAFVYAGAHGPANGLDVVLDAADDLMRRGERRAQIVLLGDEPSRQELIASA